jgi:transposase
LRKGLGERVVFEPTGPYHRAFERTLGVADVPCAKVNPRQARRFAEAIGSLAKTDRLDAAMLARMGAMLQLKTRPPRSDALLALKELHLAREALVKDRTAAKNRSKVLTASLLKRQNTQRLEQIDRQMAAIEAAILEQIRADPDLAQRFAILTSIPGVSAITAFALLIEMPELGALEAGQAASLAGLAPVARQVRPLDRTRLHPRRPSHRPPGHLPHRIHVGRWLASPLGADDCGRPGSFGFFTA